MTKSPVKNPLSWLWLLTGASLLPFAHIQTILPLAPWLAPLFLIRFLRKQRLAVGIPALLAVYAIAAGISLRNGFIGPSPDALFLTLVSVGYGTILSIPYLVDRLLTPRLNTGMGMLVFPLAVTGVDWLLTFTPFYTFGSPAYTQDGFLPLIQIVSVTGMWGLSFLIAWFASTVNALWERGFDLRSALPFTISLLVVLLFGSLRLVFAPPAGPAVNVAGLTPDRTLWRYQPVTEFAGGTAEQRSALREHTRPVLSDLFARTRQMAHAGAKIVVWSETAAFILEEDESAVLAEAQSLAREEHIYLQLGVMVVLKSNRHPYGENRAILIDPAGRLAWDYQKARPVPVGDGLEIAPGPGILPTLDTPYGRLSTLICYDADVPGFVRQAGRARTGLLFDPADDWPAIQYDHSRMATFRALENGFSLLRPAAKGLLTAVDYQGRVLAQADYHAQDKTAILAALPVSGVATIYSFIGDSFAYLCVTGLILLVVQALVMKPNVKP